jgi:hypothetical protein
MSAWLNRGAAISLCAGAFASCLWPLAVQSRPMTPAEKRFPAYSGNVPLCDDSSVLSYIQSRFAGRESEFWDSGLQIAGYDKIAEIGFRSTGLDYIPRRYCIARVTLNSGKVSTLSYAIGEDTGWLGAFGWGVDWCVEGLDRSLSHGGGCKTARP